MGSGKISDFERIRMIVDYLETGSAQEAAERNSVSETTVRRAIRDRKRLSCIVSGEDDSRNRQAASGIVAKCLEILGDEEKLRGATVSQLTSAISSLSDSFLSEGESGGGEDDPLSRSILEMAKDLKSDKPQ
ncbi:MAG: DUF1804 family protein [Oscillospiraceae bacterium]|nr:DUF1804 family protein [Oscillospiraceae bacterium]